MANVVLTVLSMTIGFFFILIGTFKLTPAISEEVYRQMRKNFIKGAKVFPLQQQTGFRPNPHLYRQIVGTSEVICGIIMAIIPGPLKQLANLVLLCVMGFAVYTHMALKESMEVMTPALVFTLLLACRFIVYLQVSARERRQEEEYLKAQMAAQQGEMKNTQEKKTQ